MKKSGDGVKKKIEIDNKLAMDECENNEISKLLIKNT